MYDLVLLKERQSACCRCRIFLEWIPLGLQQMKLFTALFSSISCNKHPAELTLNLVHNHTATTETTKALKMERLQSAEINTGTQCWQHWDIRVIMRDIGRHFRWEDPKNREDFFEHRSKALFDSKCPEKEKVGYVHHERSR